MKVLSLFDGISCGMVALERAGLSVESYAAYETDKYAVTISYKNYPHIKHFGDVFDGDFSKFKGYDLLIGGSPCTYWSIAKKDRETSCDGIGFKLFMEYVRALNESQCRYFLYENNYSIHKDIKTEISKCLGVEPIMINSALLSAQQRKRCYWTNIPNVTQPEDKGILLKDIIESGLPWQDKSYCMTSTYSGAIFKNTLERKQRTMIAEPYVTGISEQVQGRKINIDGKYLRVYEANKNQKANCLTSCTTRNMLAEPVILQRSHGFNKGGVKYNKCPTITANGSFEYNNFVAEPIRIGQYGKGGQGQRIYSVHGKSVSLKANGGGQGSNTGLYKIDLPDGDYIIRKLTPIEAERLQTLPDNYTEGISATQRYKCIGNGWTVDVIAHILKGLKEVGL